MRKSIFLLSLVVASSSFAAKIEGGRFNPAINAIELYINYSGGCIQHKFSFTLGSCLETFPVQCNVAFNEDKNGDVCKALISEIVYLPIAQSGLDDPYFKKAHLTIFGEDNTLVKIDL